MKTTQIMTAAVLMVGSGLALFAAHAQQAGISAPTCSGTISASPGARSSR